MVLLEVRNDILSPAARATVCGLSSRDLSMSEEREGGSNDERKDDLSFPLLNTIHCLSRFDVFRRTKPRS